MKWALISGFVVAALAGLVFGYRYAVDYYENTLPQSQVTVEVLRNSSLETITEPDDNNDNPFIGLTDRLCPVKMHITNNSNRTVVGMIVMVFARVPGRWSNYAWDPSVELDYVIEPGENIILCHRLDLVGDFKIADMELSGSVAHVVFE